MDKRTRDVWRQARSNPGDENLQEHLQHLAKRIWTPEADRFESDLLEHGPLDRALRWEQEFACVKPSAFPGGGKIVCNNNYNTRLVVLWVFYPSLKDVIKDLAPDDVRIVMRARTDFLLSVVDSLEGYFPGATLVSAQVADAEPEKGQPWRTDVPKPKRSCEMDKRILARVESMDGSGRVLAGENRWVG